MRGVPGGASVSFPVRHARLLAEGGPFAGKYVPDATKAYVEFEICHSLPFVAGPAQVGGYCGFHPAALSRSHEGLRHQQTNLNHMIRAYDPQNIPRDRIIGAVVDTYYPPEPDGGWVIPESVDGAIPLLVLGVVFKQAQGAMDMLTKHVEGKQTWSVSIECTCASLDDLGIWVPDKQELVPICQADDALLEKLSRDASGHIQVGNDDLGSPLALCYGAISGNIIFEGVGYTTSPAESEAEIRGIRMSASAGMSDEDFSFAESLRRSWPSIWRLGVAVAGVPKSDTGFTIWAKLRAGGFKGHAAGEWAACRGKVQATLKPMTGAAAAVTRLKWGVATGEDREVIEGVKAQRRRR